MKSRITNSVLEFCLSCLLLIVAFSSDVVIGQTKMFDDFNYESVNDPAITSFNKWSIVTGSNGPPTGALYLKENIAFKADPNLAGNSLITLSTTVDGQSKATTNSRIETSGFDYFEGTYASRVYVSDVPFNYQDANIQTFYTIVSHLLGNDGSVYSELDFEYMASDHWGIAAKQPVMYLTSWNRYIPDPWQAWKRYFAYQESFQGWHDFVVSCTDGVNVKYWIDGEYMGAMATTDSDGTSVYPRSPMQVAFANWIWNYAVGPSTDDRTTTMEVDWVLFVKDQEVSTQQVLSNVNDYRSKGIIRENLNGELAYGNVVQSPYKVVSIPGVFQAEDYDLGGQGLAFNESDNVNEGGEYRNDGVDVEVNGEGGYDVGYVAAGEWLDYTVNVLQDEIYLINARVANGGATTGVFHIEVDGNQVGQTASVANTGGWQVWSNAALGQTTLTTGEHIVTIYFESEGINVDEVEFKIDNVTSTLNTAANSVLNIYPNPVQDQLFISTNQLLKGNVVQILDSEGVIVKTTLVNDQIDVSDLNAGIYSLEVRLGNHIEVESFVKN